MVVVGHPLYVSGLPLGFTGMKEGKTSALETPKIRGQTPWFVICCPNIRPFREGINGETLHFL